jgi:hypothetical protein
VGVAVTSASIGTVGGAAAATAAGAKVFVTTRAAPTVRRVHAQQRTTPRNVVTVERGAWHMVAGDSVWTEPLDFPDADGAMLIWIPRLKWAYAGSFAGAMQLRAALAVLDARGFAPERMGTARGLSRTIGEVRTEAAGAAPGR